MSVPAAYLTVIVVWATTPLGIALSGETLHPVFSAGVRMFLAAVLGWCLLRILGIPLSWQRRCLMSYGYALLGVFVALALSYVAARTVPSGLISVLYGLAPILSAVFAQWALDEPPLPLYRWGACLIALAGLVTLFADDITVTGAMVPGLLMLLLAVALFSLSSVMVKKTGADAHPLAQTVGTLILSIPLFAITWWLLDGSMPVLDWGSPSPWATLYLALFGSLLGFVSYYYVLNHLTPGTVALITLITPVFALFLGHWFNDEVLSPALLSGSGLIVSGLGLFFFGDRLRRLARWLPDG